jgi:glycosyltransferase involved in cell wall biosynthesis
MSNPLISVVVCTYNREKFIRNCLECLKVQTLDNSKFEVIVVDNNSKDLSGQIIQTFIAENPKLPFYYYFEQNQGLSYARNRGIAESKGSWITYIDDDAEAKPEFIENILNAISKYPDAIGFGGKVIPNFVDGRPKWMSKFVESAFASKLDKGNDFLVFGKDFQGFPIGCNMTYRKSFLNDIGGFDPELGRKGDLGLAGEEKHIFMESLKYNQPVYYLPNVVVYHVIESNRLEEKYLVNLSIGIGKSENYRTKQISRIENLKKLFDVIFKFFASIILYIIYSLKGDNCKGKYIYLFRKNVTKGFFQ